MNEFPGIALTFHPLDFYFLPFVEEAEKEAYPEAWNTSELLQEIYNIRSHFFVMLRYGELIGYAGFWDLVDEAHVTRVTVLPPYRRQGFARPLMKNLIKEVSASGLEAIRLEVRETNYRAILLYLTLGFRPVRYRNGYYRRTGENALEMFKQLEPHEISVKKGMDEA
ncbi:MAG TPA: ribosomal protein S18-alanine N-acetyltransferase [Candidatus Hydrogenedentes bacterium]|nr:MAG: ribosomal-protein-alanine N-acetyltransferase [Candidatus Hydrogenedentes bacterium ADurb.Bin170]HOH42888.1 ribosomal protein S18-alanine N-acetyltransferase [Candidatus Hydrogenedentota bacterium]